MKKIFEKILNPFYPPVFRNTKIFFFNGLFEWILLVVGIFIMVFYTKLGFLLTIFWIENFMFGIILRL